MIKNSKQLALNLVKIYRIKIHAQNSQGITNYSLQDYGYKPFIFTREQLHDLIYQSAKYHGFNPKHKEAFCIFVRKFIDENLINSHSLSLQLNY